MSPSQPRPLSRRDPVTVELKGSGQRKTVRRDALDRLGPHWRVVKPTRPKASEPEADKSKED